MHKSNGNATKSTAASNGVVIQIAVRGIHPNQRRILSVCFSSPVICSHVFSGVSKYIIFVALQRICTVGKVALQPFPWSTFLCKSVMHDSHTLLVQKPSSSYISFFGVGTRAMLKHPQSVAAANAKTIAKTMFLLSFISMSFLLVDVRVD